MSKDLNTLKLKLEELKKCVENNSKKISELEEKEEVKEYIILKSANECDKKQIKFIEEYIDINTMKDCHHLYVMGKDSDIVFDSHDLYDMPFCIKCGLDSLYTNLDRVNTQKQMNIYNVCCSSRNLPYGIPEGTFLTDGDGELIKCSREEAYAICQDIVQGDTSLHNDTIEVLFLDELEKRQKNKKDKVFSKK